MKEHLLEHPQQTYIPAIAITRATLKHSWNRLPVATTSTPSLICGNAHRIGYTGKHENDLALYRLKIKMSNSLPTVTLPNLYIIEGGLFLEYEQWCHDQQGK